jgi:hypothetical protein
MIPAFVWEYKLILSFIIRVNSHLKEALCVFGGSTIQEFTVKHLSSVLATGKKVKGNKIQEKKFTHKL